MNKVEVNIGANTKEYWAFLHFEDRKGVVHERRIERKHDGTINGNLIMAATDAFRELKRPCMVDIYTKSEYIVEPFRNGWINMWEKNEWRNSKDKPVRNAEQWKVLREEMARHSVRFLYIADRN